MCQATCVRGLPWRSSRPGPVPAWRKRMRAPEVDRHSSSRGRQRFGERQRAVVLDAIHPLPPRRVIDVLAAAGRIHPGREDVPVFAR